MIVAKLIDLFFLPLKLLISMLPSSLVETVEAIEFPQIARWGAYFFPMDVAVIAVSSFATWYTIFLTWSIVEWVYKKIPGVS